MRKLSEDVTPDWNTLLLGLQQSNEARQDFGAYCFEPQRAFVTSRAKFRTASCSRRAGKSEGSAALLLSTALQKAGSVSLYITKTRINAKRIIWKTLKALNTARQLGGTPKEAELCMELPNGSSIYLLGANNRDEIEKFRGLPIAVVVLDEAQILSDLEVLIDEVLVPALMDFDGAVVLAGTPGPVPTGYFYSCTTNPEWEHHAWTVFQNPWIEKKSGKPPGQHLEEELKRRGVSADDPSIQREWFGKWVYDPNALVFRWSDAINGEVEHPAFAVGEWECVVGGDLGFDDSDALCVLAWHPKRPGLHLIHEDVMAKQGITALGDKLRALVDKYQPLSVVLDFGGLGKKIAEELTSRWALKVEAAEKTRKLEHIELLNDAMRTGIFRASPTSRFAKDCMLVEWDKSNPEKPEISERFHSDICDAVLYAHRRAKQWLSEPDPLPGPRLNSPEWHAAENARKRAELDAYWQKKDDEMQRLKAEREEMEGFAA